MHGITRKLRKLRSRKFVVYNPCLMYCYSCESCFGEFVIDWTGNSNSVAKKERKKEDCCGSGKLILKLLFDKLKLFVISMTTVQLLQIRYQSWVFALSLLDFTLLTLRRLISYIYGAPILDVSRSHTTTQHSR